MSFCYFCDELPPNTENTKNKIYCTNYHNHNIVVIIIISASMRKTQKKSEVEKNTNYRNLITQYYDKDPTLADTVDQLKPIFPEIQILDVLNQYEKKIDALIKMKRYDVQEMFVKPSQKLKRVLRVYLQYEKQESEDILKVFGHMHPAVTKDPTVVGIPKFSSFFKQISFTNQGDAQPFETWKKPTSNFVEQDGFLIRLPQSIEESAIQVKFSLISNPPKFQVDSSLQRIVGMKKGTRIAILDAFWQYIKENKLQDVENKEIINCDEKLKNTFKIEKFAFATVNNRIRELLIPLEPISLSIKPSQRQRVYDFIVEVDERPDVDIVPFFSQKIGDDKSDNHPYLSVNTKIKKYEKKFQEHSQKLRRHLAKKQLYENFTADSVQQIINQQNELLKIIRKYKPTEDQNKLEFVLDNEEEVQREIKHYYEQLNTGSFNSKE